MPCCMARKRHGTRSQDNIPHIVPQLAIFAWMNSKLGMTDETWMSRCFDLARRGLGSVSPNPPVGAVLVYEDRILGEGYHGYFGGPHAEVEAIRSVSPEDRHLVPLSTLYVSLEPCRITGKTPPCTDLILREGIMDVRVSTNDPNPSMAGSSLQHLRSKGIKITEGILKAEGNELIRTFSTNILFQRPHVILKWAQSKYNYIGTKGEQVWLSQPETSVWTHKQRSEVDAILIGARTVETDNPSLTTRHYTGKSPHRVIYDPNGRLHQQYHVFNDDGCMIYYFSINPNPAIDGTHIITTSFQTNDDHLRLMLDVLYAHQIGILLVEGGAYLHNMFIQEALWDEAWVIKTQHPLDKGIVAPNVWGRLMGKVEIGGDVVVGIMRKK